MHDKRHYFIRFKVRGSWGFPLDMLRYDACFPIHPEDTIRMEISVKGNRQPDGYVIELGHYAESRNWRPTAARWASFGWHVIEITDLEDAA